MLLVTPVLFFFLSFFLCAVLKILARTNKKAKRKEKEGERNTYSVARHEASKKCFEIFKTAEQPHFYSCSHSSFSVGVIKVLLGL